MNENLSSVLLGTVIAHAEQGILFPEGITAEMFESSKNRLIFSTASEMIREGTPPNLILLSQRLQSEGKLDEIGGTVYLAELTSIPGASFPSLIGRYGEALKQQTMDKEAALAIREAAEGLKVGSPELVVPGLLKKLSAYDYGNIKQPFRLTRLDSIEIKPASWIVNEMIEEGSFCSLYGDSGVGKSFLAIELAACIATGTLFHGISVKQGPVIYIAGEGHSGLARRFKAWSIARDVSLKDAPLYLSAGAIALIEPAAMIPVCKAMEKLINEIGNPYLVILDTWSRVLGGDDSSPSDAAAGVAALDRLRARYGNFAAMVVHHEGYTKGRGRGWSGLRAAIDMEYRVERSDEILRLECRKSKDTGGMEPMAFQFMGVELPIRNESGAFITSAVMNRIEWEPVQKTGKQPAMGKNQTLALDTLKRLAASGSVTVDTWRETCLTEGMARQRFNEAKNSLVDSGRIKINNLFVTVCERTDRTNDPLLYKGVVPFVRPDIGSTNGTDEKANESDISFASFEEPPPDISPEYKECYELAVCDCLSNGRTPEQAAQEAREAVLEFASLRAEL